MLPRMTYSLIARDPRNGEMGVATQSQAFAVGSSVSWAVPGTGVIATQSIGEPMYGELGLDLLRGGLTAPEALDALRHIDPHPERRQVGMVDSYGGIAVYTGDACVPAAGHHVGPCSAALANMLTHEGVWKSMVETFESTEGTLAFRLLEALRVAEAGGGDVRGSRSSAILVVRAQRSGRPWRDHVIDLRVDDHPDPVTELTRMAHYGVRYQAAVRAFELALDGEAAEGLALIEGAELAIEAEPELALLHASVLGKAGRTADAKRLLEALAHHAPAFAETARRFGAAKLLHAPVFDGLTRD
jgi:uncharacterized Ntn-hydrolase superfamily protein